MFHCSEIKVANRPGFFWTVFTFYVLSRALVHRARHPTEHHPSQPDAAERETVSLFRDNARDRMVTFGEILMHVLPQGQT